jgi:integrase
LDLRDQAIVLVLRTTAAGNGGVRLLRVADLDLARGVLVLRSGNGATTLEVALHPETGAALIAYLKRARPLLLRGSGR